MNGYENWAGNSNTEMANSLQVLVEATPQIPVGKIIDNAKTGLVKSGKVVANVIRGRKVKPQFIENSPQDATY